MKRSIENYIESNFPLATDRNKRRLRMYYRMLKSMPLIDVRLPETAKLYNQSIVDCERDNKDALTRICEIGFANDRRAAQIV